MNAQYPVYNVLELPLNQQPGNSFPHKSSHRVAIYELPQTRSNSFETAPHTVKKPSTMSYTELPLKQQPAIRFPHESTYNNRFELPQTWSNSFESGPYSGTITSTTSYSCLSTNNQELASIRQAATE
jgi:hypothetical protein